MQLVLNTHGLIIRVKDKVFHISAGDEYRRISPDQVDSIAVTAPCMFSSSAIMLAADAAIPIYFFDRTGDVYASLRSPYFESLATLRRKQVYFSDLLEGAKWVIQQFNHKTLHQIQLLHYLKNRKSKHRVFLETVLEEMNKGLEKLKSFEQIPDEEWGASLMGWEGSQARKYWRALSHCLPSEWQFKVRSRRPAKDPFNALINYSYGILYNMVEQALFGAGLDPYLGILHADEYDSPTLSYDLIEPFRPWIDRFVVQQIITGKISNDFFKKIEDGIFLNTNGKKFLIPAINEWMDKPVRWQKRQQSRQAHIFRTAAELAKSINKITK